MTPSSRPRLLRLRARMADALVEPDAARLLRGFAETLAKDPTALARIRTRVEEQVPPEDVEPGPIAQVWRDVLSDLMPPKPMAMVPPPRAPAPPPPAPPRPTPAESKLRQEVAALRSQVTTLTALVEELKLERDARATGVFPGAVEDALRVCTVPDGRTWLEVTTAICTEHQVRVEDVTGPSRRKRISDARHHVWWWLKMRSGADFSYPRIGYVFRRDHTTVLYGVDRHETRVSLEAAGAAPPSGPRLRAGEAA